MPLNKDVEQVIENVAQQYLEGKLDVNEGLGAIVSNFGNDAGVHFLRLLFASLLLTKFGLSEEASNAVSLAVVYDENTAHAVVRALGGDGRALDSIIKGIPTHLSGYFKDQGLQMLQQRFQDYLQSQFSLDKKTAAAISQQIVTERNAVVVKNALNGDKRSMDALVNNLGTDLAVLMMRPRFKQFVIELGFSQNTADGLSISFINETNVVDVKKAMEGDENAKRKVGQALMIASLAQGLKSL
jgi:hypothetical protein